VRLMRITNAESGRMPEIGQFTYKQGTAPTIAYLTDLIRRRIRPGGSEVRDPQEAAVAFLYLVVGGPASMTAWGIVLNQADIDRHTRYCVRLFLHGLLQPSEESTAAPTHAARSTARRRIATAAPPVAATHDANKLRAIEEENRRLKILLADAMLEVAMLKDPTQLRRE
jgi:AefR-like transcriptional repressor, C-terminal domain